MQVFLTLQMCSGGMWEAKLIGLLMISYRLLVQPKHKQLAKTTKELNSPYSRATSYSPAPRLALNPDEQAFFSLLITSLIAKRP